MAVIDEEAPAAAEADRFRAPLCSGGEAASFLGVPETTFSNWAYGYVRRSAGRPEVRGDAIVTALERSRPGAATVPFIGLADGLVLAAIRKAGVPLQRIRPAIAKLHDELGLDHVLRLEGALHRPR